MDLAGDFAIPLPMLVIGDLLGLPPDDGPLFRRWSDAILALSYTVSGGAAGVAASEGYAAATHEMRAYLSRLIDARRTTPRDDLLTRLVEAEIDGDRLSEADILGFFQLLLVAGTETTTNLIDNFVLCLAEHPDQDARLRATPALLESAIEETLRYRTPVQWMFRATRRAVEIGGQTIPAGKLVLPVIGAANRDPAGFPDADRFDVARQPNPHIGFGHGIHFCLGAPLARLEARIALGDLLRRFRELRPVDLARWEPRKASHVHGPARLPVQFVPA
jgi:cytochrome P450